jgi:two-component system, NarL family, invasion response regulator UvrY
MNPIQLSLWPTAAPAAGAMELGVKAPAPNRPAVPQSTSVARPDTQEPGVSRPLRVLIADDHDVVRAGLKQVLTDNSGSIQFGEAATGNEVLALAASQPWDVALLDISMPEPSGLKLLRQLKALRPAMPVLVLSMHPEDQYGVRVLKAGAAGYLTKNTASEEVASAIRRVLLGRLYMSGTLAASLARSLKQPAEGPSHRALPDREYEILCRMVSGKSLKEISSELFLSNKTVSLYRTRLMRKLGVRTTAEAISYAVRAGLVE